MYHKSRPLARWGDLSHWLPALRKPANGGNRVGLVRCSAVSFAREPRDVTVRPIIAIAAGPFITSLLLSLNLLTYANGAWQVFELPGIIAMMLVWGPHGPAPDVLSLALLWAVNAIVYGLVAVALVRVLKISS